LQPLVVEREILQREIVQKEIKDGSMNSTREGKESPIHFESGFPLEEENQSEGPKDSVTASTPHESRTLV
jgi:hypothetical protein